MTEPLVVKIGVPQVRAEENEVLRKELLEMLDDDQNQIILDFTGVEFVDSSFLGMLIIVLKRCTAKKGDLRICCLSAPLHGIFDLMRLTRIISIYETPEEAIKSFNE